MSAPIHDWISQAATASFVGGDPDIADIEQAVAAAYQAATQSLTCVYCGHAYPPGTPSHGAQVLTDHIRVCEKHPMRALQQERDRFRAALVQMVGVDTKEELEQMEAVIRLTVAPAADKAGIIDAIHALIATA